MPERQIALIEGDRAQVGRGRVVIVAALSWACGPGLREAELKLLRACTRAGAAGAKGEDSGDQGRERQVTCMGKGRRRP